MFPHITGFEIAVLLLILGAIGWAFGHGVEWLFHHISFHWS